MTFIRILLFVDCGIFNATSHCAIVADVDIINNRHCLTSHKASIEPESILLNFKLCDIREKTTSSKMLDRICLPFVRFYIFRRSYHLDQCRVKISHLRGNGFEI